MPARLAVAPTRDHFLLDGTPSFYLADSVWNAFSGATLEEWAEYLSFRRAQGFNAVQISVLPIPYDSSDPDVPVAPFRTTQSGRWDFRRINPVYFKKAARMAAMARAQGFTPALAVLWCNYLRDTWGARRAPGFQMPRAMLKPFAEFVARTFAASEPVYIISASTKFENERVESAYHLILETIKASDPGALTTMHMATHSHLPERFVGSRALDFYGYQSGHRFEYQDMAYKLAQHYHRLPARRPIANVEGVFEGHGHSKGNYGRFDAFHVRRALWQSVLGGAKAGYTYGAHGTWSWHRRGHAFSSTFNSGVPFDWRTALRFRGATDAAFARWVFEQHRLFDLEPRNDLLANETEEIRVAQSADGRRVAIYSPYNVDLRLKARLAGYNWTMLNLSNRDFGVPEVLPGSEETIIRMPEFNADALYLAVK